MSAEQERTINIQQSTIRKQLVVIERQRRAIGDALAMIRAGHYQQAERDLVRGITDKRGR